uniref:Uncharacterized protein n=2 Tax=Kalanchoe fedtschenkoi TaxID=63787 RepID=A0A7N1A9T8_KALFE
MMIGFWSRNRRICCHTVKMDMKGITWFGNVYQKFETMCLEVEEAVCKDTVKYVENQVQTVGASVKKFYSEVVDDLLSPSLLDPVKVNSFSCTGVHKKPKMGVKEEPEKQLFEDRHGTAKVDKNSTYASSFDRFSVADPAVPCNPVNSSDVLSSNFAVGSKRIGDATKKSKLVIKRKPRTSVLNSPEMVKATDPAAVNPSKEPLRSGIIAFENQEAPTDQMFEPQLDPDAVPCDSKEIEGRADDGTHNLKPEQIAGASVKPANIIPADGAIACHPKESVDGRSFEALDNLTNILPSDTSSDLHDVEKYGVPYADADAHGFSYSYAEEWTIQTEETDGWNIETITSDDDVEEDTEIVDMNFSNLVVLEESCVIVDRENLPSNSHKEPKHKSYKKKFRDAFSPRGKLMRKKEYRQLASLYESTANVELDEQNASSSLHTPTPNSELKKLKSAQSCESEWEIL